MLEPEEMETAAGGMDSEIEDYQRELLTIEAAGLLGASTLAGYHAARERITREMMTAAAKHAPKLRKAAARTYSQALRYSAVEDAEAARMSEGVRQYHVAEARMRAEQAAEAFRAEPLAREMARSASNDMMRRATGLAVARASSGAAGYERAVASAVADLSARGVTAFTYTRVVDGIPRTVRMSADAYVRQRLLTDIKRETYETTLSAAGISGANLVAVSCTITCRDTHAPWEGRIYQLNGSGKYPNFYERTMYVYGTNPNWAEGLGGYNCNHSFRIWHPGIRRDDPLKDTGYTRHEAAEIVGRQRTLERGIRASKRQREVMRANGLDTNIVGARLRRQTAALNQLIADHPQILRREIWRERTGEAIRRAQGTEGVVHLDATAAAEVRRQAAITQAARAAKRKPYAWTNPAVSALAKPEDVARYLSSNFGIEARESFQALPLDTQRAATAGIARAVELYGEMDAAYIKAMVKNYENIGAYTTTPGTIHIAENADDAYAVGLHEAIHAIDAYKSSKMREFASTSGIRAYNIHSKKVLDAALKDMGWRSNSRKYSDELMRIFWYEPKEVKRYIKQPWEIVAHAIELNETGRASEFTKAVARRFAEKWQ